MLPSFEATLTPRDSVQAVGRLVAADLTPMTAGEDVPGPLAELRGFTGKVGETLVRPLDSGIEILVGAGPRESFGSLEVRRAAASLVRARGKASNVALDLRGVAAGGLTTERLVQAAVEGAGGAAYRFELYKSREPESVLESMAVVVDDEGLDDARRGIGRGSVIAAAVSWARDLANRVPGDVTPTVLAEEAGEVAERGAVTIEVWDEEKITAEHLGGLLGVARGSSEPPRLVRMTYEPDEAVARPDSGGRVPTVVLVGKGITFDSGGLSLKTPEGMVGMKMDMSGAADVIATVGACRALGVGVRVVAIAPITENMPGGRAIKPGDVLTTRNGKTIEVLNTDAEGRLVLADGLALAAELEPDVIVDIATLTGPCIIALGTKVAGLMGNDSHAVGSVEEAAGRAGEPVWRLPLPREYAKDFESQIADMKNTGKARQGGALIAGLILEEFVADRPWAHLDIAGPSDSDDERYEIRKGATGFGVRTLLEFVQEFRPIEGAEVRMADHIGVG
ncbi:MAG: leucyl aminopeptidase [Acidimicrobiales bacterium]